MPGLLAEDERINGKRNKAPSGMVVWRIDETRQRPAMPRDVVEWIYGRMCPCCGESLPVNSHHWHRNAQAFNGFRTDACIPCRRQKESARARNNYRKRKN
jgi:hypothetical protein